MSSMEYHFSDYAEVLLAVDRRKRDAGPQSQTVEGLTTTVLPAAKEFHEICRRSLDDLTSSEENYLSPKEEAYLRLEQDTWSLLEGLYEVRLQPPIPLSSARDVVAKNPYTPPTALLQRVLDTSPLLTELQVVMGWLRDTAPTPQPPEQRPVYRMYTKRQIQQARRQGNFNERSQPNLVKSLDPDVLNRESGLSLDPQDDTYEKSLSYALFGYIRAGLFSEALEICSNCDQPWMAAALSGTINFSWNAITSRDEPSGLNDITMDSADPSDWSGNRRRKLWRETCHRLASSPSVPTSTRALFASVCLSPRSMPAITPLLRTWEDHLWAKVEMLYQERVSSSLEALGGFWEHGASIEVGEHVNLDARMFQLATEAQWQDEVFDVVSAMMDVKVEEGLDSKNSIHYAQLCVILGLTDKLLTEFAELIEAGQLSKVDEVEAGLSLRFYSHLCLFLRLLQKSDASRAENVILRAYISFLENKQQYSLVAMYVSALGETAVQEYAEHLARLDANLSRDEKWKVLRQCQDHGLDVHDVAIQTTAKIAHNIMKQNPIPAGTPLSDAIVGPPTLYDDEKTLIRSLDWVMLEQSTWYDALRQANACTRYFLGRGRLWTALTMHSTASHLVRRGGNVDFQSVEATEYIHYDRFFRVINALEDIAKLGTGASRPPTERVAWKDEYLTKVDIAYEAGLDLLTNTWLRDPLFAELYDTAHTVELERTRNVQLPDLVIRLNRLLLDSSQYARDNLHRAMDMVTIVADERYEVYPALREADKLYEYLSAVREVGVELLGQGKGDTELFHGLKRGG